jgi:hypothetical protein
MERAMVTRTLLVICLLALHLAGCGRSAPSGKVAFDFRDGAQGWQAGFADYPPGQEQFFQLQAGIRELPAGIEPSGMGYFISGSNHSDDLYMFLKRKLGQAEGVRPNTTYRLAFKLVFASNAPGGCLGVGGSPGEGVTLKAGGADIEPTPVLQADMYRMNVEIGDQTQGGPAGSVVGNIANGLDCDEAAQQGMPYVSQTREHTSEFPITSGPNGELWLLVGTDSGFEAVTALYYQRIEVELIPR